MKALELRETNTDPIVCDLTPPIRQAGEALIRVEYAALNRRDVWIRRGQYPGIELPIVLGSDGAGTVCETDDDHQHWLGREVVIYPGRDWGPDERFQSPDYRILGLPDQGTFAEYISVPISCLREKPSHLTSAEAAALPLAGLTAWRALVTRGRLKENERVLVTGIGGGVAQFAATFTHALGGQLAVTSGHQEKLEQVDASLGRVSYREDGWQKRLASQVPAGFDIIIDGAGGADFGGLIRLLAPGGRLVFYGGTCGRWPAILPQHLFFKQAEILGSTMGSPADFDAMLACVTERKLRPKVDRTFSFDDGARAFDYLESAKQLGKVVIHIGSS